MIHLCDGTAYRWVGVKCEGDHAQHWMIYIYGTASYRLFLDPGGQEDSELLDSESEFLSMVEECSEPLGSGSAFLER